jgi:hypothetical protein
MHEYELRYLPQFHEDLKQHVLYIAQKLKNPQAANDLIDSTEAAILERLPEAEAFERFNSRKERQYPYYRIYVKNFIVFYVVIPENGKKVMEIRRFLFGKSNWKRTI